MSEIVLENVGPIRSLVIPVPQGGGVVVLEGPNGAGKTTALDGVAALVSGGKPPSLKDGERKGRIEGLGAKLHVGLSSRRSGALEVRGLEGRLDVSDLVDPGIAAPEAADAKRIKALMSLSGATASAETFGDVFPGGPDGIEAVVPSKVLADGDALEIAGAVKRSLEKIARDHETVAENLDGKASALAAQVGDATEESAPDEAALRRDHAAAVQDHMQAQAQRRAGLEAAENAKSARENLEALRSKESLSVEECDGEIARLEGLIGEAREEKQRLEKLLGEVGTQLLNRTSDLDAWKRRRVFASQAAETIARCESAIKEAEGKAFPTEEEVEAAREKIDAVSKRIGEAAVVREALKKRSELDGVRKQAAAARGKAEKAREGAASVDEVLSHMVSRLGVALQVKVVDAKTRLVTKTGRGDIPFAELSAGERWRLALDIAIEAVGKGGLLTIKQEAWEGLDPDNRAAIAEHCRNRGVVVITAAAAGGDTIVPVIEGSAA